MKFMFKKYIIYILPLTLLVGYAFASSKLLYNHIKQVSYNPHSIVTINSKPLINTQVEFASDEQIIDIECGDSVAWSITVNKSIANIINIKPLVSSSNTDLIVITSNDATHYKKYFFHLLASPGITYPATYSIKFLYPLRQQHQLQQRLLLQQQHRSAVISKAVAPQHMNWSYAFSGNPRVVPMHVFDDGNFTYMQFRKNQVIPAVFVVDSRNGSESVVNYRMHNNTMLIMRTAPQFTLRSGKFNVASIFNEKKIHSVMQQKKGY